MTISATNYQIVLEVCVFYIVKRRYWDSMMNVEIKSILAIVFFTSLSTQLTFVLGCIECVATFFVPVFTVVISMSSFPRWMIFSSPMEGFPLRLTLLIAKVVVY
jgi:hypothetical protein